MLSRDRIHVFLNFEGVLVERGAAMVSQGTVVCESGNLWRWADRFVELSDVFDLALVVRSSWTLQLPLNSIVAAMPPELGGRVVGAADAIAELRFSGVTRIAWQYDVIERYVREHSLLRWCAVDDREERWPDSERWRLVLCDEKVGMSDPATQLTLRKTLELLMQG